MTPQAEKALIELVLEVSDALGIAILDMPLETLRQRLERLRQALEAALAEGEEPKTDPHGQPHLFINGVCQRCGAVSTEDPVACVQNSKRRD